MLTYIGWLLAITFIAVGFGMLMRGRFVLGVLVVLVGVAFIPGTLLLT